MNKGFTLIELLAVLAILSIILLIAVPKVLSTVQNTKMAAFRANAQMVLKAIELESVHNLDFDHRLLNETNIKTLLKIDNTNYDSLSVTNQEGKTQIAIVGKKAWDGIIAYGSAAKMYSKKTSDFEGFADTSGANKPEMPSNMIPVYYDESASVWKKADVNNLVGTFSWYSYNTKMWANAVTLTESSREDYKNAPSGTIINDEDVLTTMVFIPRYKYLIPEGTGARSISIIFEKQTKAKSNGNAITTYKTHPTFTFKNKELSGIWVSKYEVTGTINDITSKPNLNSISGYNVSAFATAFKNMTQTSNPYGYISSETDIYMIKNSDWGAVSYLANSEYGKNSEVWINPNNLCLTGQSGATVDAIGTNDTNSYETPLGVNASTTGNIYGIYDMSGGTLEYVMGNFEEQSGHTITQNSGFSGLNGQDSSTTSGLAFPASDYYNLYNTSIATTACDGEICYGDALSETYGWNDDTPYFVYSGYPWFVRGGNYNDNIAAGLFYSSGAGGNAISGYYTSRFVQREV